MIRTVPIDHEQAEKIERLGVDLMREGEYEDATMLLAIALAWKVSPVARFKCDIDESAGLRDLNDVEKTRVAMLRKRYTRSRRKPW